MAIERGRYPHKIHSQQSNSQEFNSEIDETNNKVNLSTSLDRINIEGILTVNDEYLNNFTEIIISGNTLRYNSSLDCLEIAYDNGTILQLGRENTTLVYCETDIPNGTPVYYEGVGSKGAGFPTAPIAKIASADNIATAMVKGTTTLEGVAGEYCIITCAGSVTKEGHGFITGSQLYLNTGAGGFTTTPPSNPNITVLLGLVLDADNLFVCIPIVNPINQSGTNINSQLFLSTIDSSVSGYKTLSKTLDVAETTKTITATSGTSPVAGEKYLSDELGITTLPAGVFLGHTNCKVDSTVGVTTLTVDVSIYHINGTKTLLNSVTSLDLNMTTETPVEFSAPYSTTSTVETDRLLVETYLTTTSATNKTFTYYIGNGRATYITIPLPISHTDLINKNTDPNFLHVTSSQINAFGNKVDGPTSAVDNAIARFDGITGKLIQNSGVIIDDSGNVGIGTGSPTAKLDISDGNITMLIGANNLSNTRINAVNKVARIGTAHYLAAEEPVTLIQSNSSASANEVILGGGTGIMNAATAIKFYTAANTTTLTGTERMSILPTGEILALGSAFIFENTSYEIKAQTNNSKRLRIGGGPVLDTGNGAYVNLQGNDYGGTGLGGFAQYFAGNSTNGGDHVFYTGDGVEKMRILKNGNVGIGFTDPNGILEINATVTNPRITGISTSSGLDYYRINGTRTAPTAVLSTNVVGGINFYGQYSTTVGQTTQTAAIQVVAGANFSSPTAKQSNMLFFTSPTSGGVTERMRIAADGNVGIGTNNPSKKLHVIGDTLASGDSASATKTIGGKVRMEYDTATDTLEFNFI